MQLSRLRNIGIAAHIDAGKTTVTEHILHITGLEHRIGQVDEGTTVMDWMPEERERGITISAAATTVPWRDHQINVIDTPGHVDFTVEVERCMRVLDGAVLVLDAVAGVQAQSETVWRQIRRNGIPAIGFVNKCDRVGADFLAAVRSVHDKLGAEAVAVQWPLFVEGRFVGVIDLLERRAWVFDSDDRMLETPLPEEARDDCELLRSELCEKLSDHDEEVLTACVEEREPALGALRAALRRATLSGGLLPVLCGAALRCIGIQPLLDAIVDYLPSPADRPPVRGYDAEGRLSDPRLPDPEAGFLALAFKLHASEHGDLTFVRIYAGRVQPGDKLWNPRVRRMERAARLIRIHGEGGRALEAAGPGEIVAMTGLKLTGTGDTLCERASALSLEPPLFPEPVMALVVEPASAASRPKLREALLRLAHEDPSFRVREDEASGQWTIQGMGELHLEVQLHRLEREFHLDARVGRPRVSYREAVRGEARGSARVERVVGTSEVFGAVELVVQEAEEGLATRVVYLPGCPIPAAFRPAVEEALLLEALTGPRFGFPLLGCTVRVTGGESREHQDNEAAFAQAAIQALRHALAAAEVSILEPRMAFQVDTPEEFSSGILADLASRGAQVQEVVPDRGSLIVRGQVPLASMFGYSTSVRSLSQGRAGFSMTPAGFSPLEERALVARGLA